MSGTNNQSIMEFSSIEIQLAESILKTLDPSRFDSIGYFGVHEYKKNYGKEFEAGKIRKCHFTDCTFTDVFFDGSPGVGTTFKECTFDNVRMLNANFDFSDFSSAKIFGRKYDIKSSSFAYANFNNATIDNLSFEGSNFENSYLDNTTIQKTRFKHCNFESADIKNTSFEDIDFAWTSVDFASFKNTCFKNVKFRLESILHSFGGLQCIVEKGENVSIKFPSSDKEISFDDFISKLKDIQAFFYKTKDFFILANINIFFNNHDLAYKYLAKGLAYSLQYKDFRMIGYLCKLASQNHFFTRKQLRLLYERLESQDIIQSMTLHEHQVYQYEMIKIKRILIDNPFGKPQMKITFKTDICHKEVQQSADFQKYIFESIEEHVPQATYFLTVRHNSPLVFELFLSDNTLQMLNYSTIIIGTLFGATMGVVTMIEKIKKIKNLAVDTKIKELDLQLRQQQLQQNDINLVAKDFFDTKSSTSTVIKSRIISISMSIDSDNEVPEDLRYVLLRNDNHNKE